MIITIDGPTASGKSTVARMVAHELGFYYLASGMLFRAIAYVLLYEQDYTLDTLIYNGALSFDPCTIVQSLRYTYDPVHREQIAYKGTMLNALLKTPTIDQAASIISQNMDVRACLLAMQRSIAQEQDVVVDGRDCGSVVFPYAELKFFLTASPEIRAQRWQKDQEAQGIFMTIEQALHELQMRDDRDRSRPIAPLVIPSDAIIIDSSSMQIQEIVTGMVNAARRMQNIKD
ncbi:(d)CMP kinase [Candidatus Dependentiae bacterium]|nr:(d)CMP kinase [Candidatus Dependentiae bacterium]